MLNIKNIEKIIYYNHFHLGDVHLSRTFIQKISEKVLSINPMVRFFYAQRNDKTIIQDITNIKIDTSYFKNISNENICDFTLGRDLYINTWYASKNHFYMNQYGITFDCLYALFDDVCKRQLGFSLKDISLDPIDFFPEINHAFYNTFNVANWACTNDTKKIFVSNCKVLSGQAHDISLTSIICKLANNFPNYTFILTNKYHDVDTGNYNNIVYSSDIIKSSGFDLNENEYLSRFCDVIIGQASGAFTFAFSQPNLFKRNAKIIALCNLIPNKPGKFWLGKLFEDKINYSADISVSNESNENIIINLIESKL
jgi:hypothetical protein